MPISSVSVCGERQWGPLIMLSFFVLKLTDQTNVDYFISFLFFLFFLFRLQLIHSESER